jgi:hypothetical protein
MVRKKFNAEAAESAEDWGTPSGLYGLKYRSRALT